MSDEFFDEALTSVAAWNSHDGRELAALMAEDGIYEDVALGRVMDPAAVVDFVAETHAMSSDYVLELVSAQRSGNNYATEWLMGGTNDGPLQDLGLPATGKQWKVRGASVGQLDDDGRIKLNRDYWNLAAFLTQVGVLPPPPSATEAAGGAGQ